MIRVGGPECTQTGHSAWSVHTLGPCQRGKVVAHCSRVRLCCECGESLRACERVRATQVRAERVWRGTRKKRTRSALIGDARVMMMLIGTKTLVTQLV